MTCECHVSSWAPTRPFGDSDVVCAVQSCASTRYLVVAADTTTGQIIDKASHGPPPVAQTRWTRHDSIHHVERTRWTRHYAVHPVENTRWTRRSGIHHVERTRWIRAWRVHLVFSTGWIRTWRVHLVRSTWWMSHRPVHLVRSTGWTSHRPVHLVGSTGWTSPHIVLNIRCYRCSVCTDTCRSLVLVLGLVVLARSPRLPPSLTRHHHIFARVFPTCLTMRSV